MKMIFKTSSNYKGVKKINPSALCTVKEKIISSFPAITKTIISSGAPVLNVTWKYLYAGRRKA